MNRIDKKFKALKQKKRKAFIAFITAGYPDLRTTERLVLEFAKSGVDIVELGAAFSDPLADGPVIQESSQAALEKKINLTDILHLVKRLRRQTEIPICLMTYYNLIFCFGEKKFVRQATQAGIDGIIIPDLPPEEAKTLRRLAKNKLATVFFLSPTSPAKRIKLVAGASEGFIYYVSLTGVTGARNRLPSDIAGHLKTIKRLTHKPVCVGFGVSHPQQVKEIYKIADGVIVGSAIIRKIKANLSSKNLVKNVARQVLRLCTIKPN